MSSSLRTAVSLNVAEILREAGDQVRAEFIDSRWRSSVLSPLLQGLHVTDISKISNVNPAKLGKLPLLSSPLISKLSAQRDTLQDVYYAF